MATIIQAPLYVPRPGDPTVWQGGISHGDLTLRLLTSVTFFGAPGQVPNVLRKFDIELAEPVWQGKPLPSIILVSSLSPGQTKPRWPWHFEQDDRSYWVGAPLESNLLAQLLTAAGQVKPRIPWHFEQDDGSLWTGESLPSEVLSVLLTSVGKVGPRWPWNFGEDSPPVWSGSPLESNLLAQLLTNVGQTKPRWPWSFAEDHIPQWQFEGQTNRSLITSLVVTAPFIYVPWQFGLDDRSSWQGKPTASLLLADLLTSVGQVKPRLLWNFGLHEAPDWCGQTLPLGERNLILLTTKVGTPFVNLPFAFGMDFSSYWVGGPTPSYTTYIPPPPPFSLGGDWLVLARRRFRR